jgi:DNA-binding beta-propeller fold protein YncE
MTLALLGLGLLLSAPTTAPRALTSRSVDLPGGPPVIMDYLAYDAAADKVWIPAGNTGKVDVLDAATGKVESIDGFETEKRTVQREGKSVEVTAGPSSAYAGDGVVYVGNRAGFRVCAVDSKSHERKGCVQLAASPDGVAYVAATKEIWVTTPRTNSLTILDASAPAAPKAIEGDRGHVAVNAPEGYAVDDQKGFFYTNLEDGDRTVVFDVKTRKKVADWEAGCGKTGPRGLSLDVKRQLLFVACGAGGVFARSTKDGKQLGHIDTAGGVDNIDYLAEGQLLYIASGKDGAVTIAQATPKGGLSALGTAKTAEGSRVVVADKHGNGYAADSKGGKIWIISHP